MKTTDRVKNHQAIGHTPGPWEAIGSHKAHFVRTKPNVLMNGSVMRVVESTAIAEVRESNSIAEQKANARLMAASPMLLWALEDLVEQVRNYANSDDADLPDWSNAICIIDQATRDQS